MQAVLAASRGSVVESSIFGRCYCLEMCNNNSVIRLLLFQTVVVISVLSTLFLRSEFACMGS
jgi:hypothetical protein